MPTDQESFLKGIRTYCERNDVSQYDAVLCEKAAEYSVLYTLDPEAFERGFSKVAAVEPEYEEAEEEDANPGLRGRLSRFKRLKNGLTWERVKPWLIGGAVATGALGLGLGLGSRYGRHAERTHNPYGPIRGSAIDFGEWITGKYLRYHPEWENNPPVKTNG